LSREYDFVIVGAGATGCLVASQLAARFPQASILLVEAGRESHGIVNAVPLLSGFAPFAKARNWLHPASHVNRSTLLYQGRMVGGSSEINGMVVSRGFSDDYRLWQDVAGDAWSFENCLSAFRRLEDFSRGASELHGKDGPIHVRAIEPYGPLPQAFIEAAADAGFPVLNDLNGAGGARFGLTDVNIRAGRRHSARAAFLLNKPQNLTLLTGHLAQRIETAAGRATALVLNHAGTETSVTIGSELVLACGAIGTTALLFRSGIGPAVALNEAGINPVLDHGEIGRNLQNHPSFLLRVPTHGGSMADLLHPIKGAAAGLQYLGNRTGPLAQGLFQAAGYFPAAGEDMGLADAQVVMSPALFGPAPPGKRPPLPCRHGASLAIQQGTPFSRGSITPTANGGLTIDTGALSDPRDLDFMQAAVSRVQDILGSPSFHRHISDRSALAPISQEDIRGSIGTAYHMAGTARMGRDNGAVTDPELRLRGMEKIRIADASVMPTIPNAALHFPSMMIAQRAVDFICADGRNRG
jgi:choline dehydrogenase